MIVCPICGGSTGVVETRGGSGYLRRRRRCDDYACDGRVTTVEMAVAPGTRGLEDAVMVLQSDLDELLGIVMRMAFGDENRKQKTATPKCRG